ncbi:hypothetical protein ASE64_01910 [Agreia sp. Leaf210]|nr:hypothetical protein ASE64_01910 [Agreia sp. Leaf210]
MPRLEESLPRELQVGFQLLPLRVAEAHVLIELEVAQRQDERVAVRLGVADGDGGAERVGIRMSVDDEGVHWCPFLTSSG